MMRPEIATILDDGTYGQREMTEEEYEALIATGWTLEGKNDLAG